VAAPGRRSKPGTGLDLGPIKGSGLREDTPARFPGSRLHRLGSVLAEVAANNSSAAFSESDMLRERLAENIGTAGDTEDDEPERQ